MHERCSRATLAAFLATLDGGGDGGAAVPTARFVLSEPDLHRAPAL